MSSLKESETEEINRILPLGLTPSEAKGWYMRHVLKPWVTKGMVAMTIGFSALLSALSPLSEYMETILPLHMILQHFLYIAAGFLLVYGTDSLIWVGSRLSKDISRAYATFLKGNSILNKHGIVTFAVATLLVGYWYLPNNFDAVLLHPFIHVEMHLSLLAAGGLIALGSKFLTRRIRQFAPIVVGKAMGLFGALMLVNPITFYAPYPAGEQIETGVALIVIMLILDLTLMPILLYNYFGKDTPVR